MILKKTMLLKKRSLYNTLESEGTSVETKALIKSEIDITIWWWSIKVRKKNSNIDVVMPNFSKLIKKMILIQKLQKMKIKYIILLLQIPPLCLM